MPFRAFGDFDTLYLFPCQCQGGSISMPFRAFGDSDRTGERLIGIQEFIEFQCPFGHSGILTCTTFIPPLRQKDSFQCPFGHSGILTRRSHPRWYYERPVSMPFRAFGDSDAHRPGAVVCIRRVSMPFRAFGDSDGTIVAKAALQAVGFQCPFGHSGILTLGYVVGFPLALRLVSMPFRAFGDSDVGLRSSSGRQRTVSMPFRAFGDSDRTRTAWRRGTPTPLFQCPFGHSGILTSRCWPCTVSSFMFQCPFGHSGILTGRDAVEAGLVRGCISMPFRAFGDSD